MSSSGEYRMDRICTDFELAWKSGKQERIEDWLMRVSAAEQARLLKELILVEIDLRRSTGESPAAGEYHARFPNQNSVVDSAFPSMPNSAEAQTDRYHAPGEPMTTNLFDSGARPGVVVAQRYTLLEKIGEGGMGEVWVARQNEPIKRNVAIKLVKPGMDSRSVVQRFEQERQALAMMDHPHIAKMLDGGMTDDRRPFFVMELVNGLTLTKFCDQMKLGIRERLEVFVLVCQAVQHAHQKGIVHRDLKPSNILVSQIDGRPVPKVIDFGVAKATGGRLTDETFVTQFGAVVGTMEYMSPEQAGFSAGDVDTRADIYSLGVILYELLTGLKPFDSQRLRKAALDELVRIIREEEPSKPSTRISTDAALASLAAARQIEPAKLTKLLRGELDWVVMKCLEKHRDLRYETANGLARDLQRYLADEAVEARPPSAAYRLRKLVRRHRGAAVAAVLVLLTLMIGVVGTTAGLFEARRQQGLAVAAQRKETERAEAEGRQRKRAEAAEAEARIQERQAKNRLELANAVVGFLENDLLSQAGSGSQADHRFQPDPNLTVKDALDRAAAAVREKFHDRPELEASIRQTLGDAYQEIGHFEKAIDQLREAADIRAVRLGDEHAATLDSLNSLATAYRFAGRTAAAIALHEKIRDVRIRKLGVDDPQTLTTLNNLAGAYDDAGQSESAILLLEQVRDARLRTLGADHPLTLTTLNNLAAAYQTAGRIVDAINLYLRVGNAREKTLGPGHPDTLTAFNNLGSAYHVAGKVPEAIDVLERVRDARVANLGADHPETFTTLNNLGSAYQAVARASEAVDALEQVRDWRVKKLGPDHPDTLTTLNNLAAAYRAIGKLSESVALHEQVRGARLKSLGPEHPDTLTTLNNLGLAYHEIGRNSDAVDVLEQARTGRVTKFGAAHPDTLTTLNNLASAYRAMGRFKEAIAIYKQVREAQLKSPQSEDLPTLTTLNLLGSAYLDAGRTLEAVEVLEQVHEGRVAKLGTEHPETLTTLNNLAAAYRAIGKLSESVALHEQVREARLKSLGPEHPDTLTTLNNLGAAYHLVKQYDKSIPLFEQALAGRRKTLGDEHPHTIATLANLGVSQREASHLDESIVLLENAYHAARKIPSLSWISVELVDTCIRAEKSAKGAALVHENIDVARTALPADSLPLAGALAQSGSALLSLKAWPEAEPILRECLAIRERFEADRWTTFNTRSMLGESLLNQMKHSEAEPLLLAGYEGLAMHAAQIPPQAFFRVNEAVTRLVRFYEATGNAEAAAKWRAKLETGEPSGRCEIEKGSWAAGFQWV